MHELAIAESVVSTIAERLGDRAVRVVHLEVGQLSGVSADSLRFSFEVVVMGTALAEAELIIDEPCGQAECATCGETFLVADLILLCACGSSDVRVLAGEDLKILSVEVAR